MIDVDSSGFLTPEEFRNGLEGLKIILNPRDFWTLFDTFDVDKDGFLDLDEIRNTLNKFESK